MSPPAAGTADPPPDESAPLLASPENHTAPPILKAKGDYEDKPWRFKLLALACSCLLSIGSHFAAHILSTLKSDIKRELDIDNTQYGLLQGSVSLVNTFIPLFGGVFIDVFGTGWGSIVASSLITFGELIVAISVSLGTFGFPVMIVGRVMYGIGAGTIVTVQETILAHWFRGKALAVTVGLQIAFSNLAGFLSIATSKLIFNAVGLDGVFWVSVGICSLSWLINMGYVALLYYLRETPKEEELKRLKKKKGFSYVDLLHLPTTFWIIILLAYIFGAIWAPFLHIATDLIANRFGKDETVAALEASISKALPAAVSPVLGMVTDRMGARTWTVFISGLTSLMAFVMLGFTMIPPIPSFVLFSISLTFGPVALISAIPLVLPSVGMSGTAFGIYKCAINIGSTIMDPIAGHIQDANNGDYHDVMLGFCTLAIIAMVLFLFLYIVDENHHLGVLDAPVNKRLAILEKLRERDEKKKMERETLAKEARESGLSSSMFFKGACIGMRTSNAFFISFNGILLIIAWVVYCYETWGRS